MRALVPALRPQGDEDGAGAAGAGVQSDKPCRHRGHASPPAYCCPPVRPAWQLVSCSWRPWTGKYVLHPAGGGGGG